MRDLDRWKDKVELSLDGRQIFFLFFGSAVAACLVFVLGVLVGKRLEARALALQPAPVEDPLAALDQLGEADDADEGLTFHKALTKDAHKAAPEKAVDKPAEPVAPVVAVAPPPAPQQIVVQKPVTVTPPPVVAEAKPAADPKPAAPKPEAKPAVAPAKAVAAAAAKPAPLPAGKPQVVAAQTKKPDATASHFTLQLSAFPEKQDAEEFMRKIQSAGYKPFLVASEIPGKGVFYRVRVGDYGSRQAAVDAKAEFERKQRMIAYVAKL
jgi:cell division septation protein DedD